MYTQFFGSYLLNKGAVTAEQLLDAITKHSISRLKLGTIAMHEGIMTASEVDECCYLQTRMDKRFGEIAIERGYLTQEDRDALLRTQDPDYLLLGQNFVDAGILTYADLERLIFEYQSDNELYELELSFENNDRIKDLIERFFFVSETPYEEDTLLYMNLMFNNLTRFIGDDFTPLLPIKCDEYPTTFAVRQTIHASTDYVSHIDMDESTAVAFASRYAREDFKEFDEYVQASLEDFLNLHNGLFIVNMSNEKNVEMTIEPPEVMGKSVVDIPSNCIVIPVIYPFGTIHLIITF